MRAQQPVLAFVGIGSNLADPVARVRAALEALDSLRSTRVVSRSSLYRTAPVGYLDQPEFINAVASLETGLAPRELLDAMFAIEQEHGRVRSVRNAPRTLDLDLLLYGERAILEPGLVIPHSRMHERAFVLAPLAEIAPDVQIGDHGSAAALLALVSDQGVTRIGPA